MPSTTGGIGKRNFVNECISINYKCFLANGGGKTSDLLDLKGTYDTKDSFLCPRVIAHSGRRKAVHLKYLLL